MPLTVIPEIKNYPILQAPPSGRPDLGQVGTIDVMNKPAAVARAATGDVFLGQTALGWMYAPHGTDASLVQQALRVGAQVINNWQTSQLSGFDPLGSDFGVASSKKYIPWNWAAVSRGADAGYAWVPLSDQGQFEAGCADWYAPFYGVPEATPIFALSDGYAVDGVSSPHAGSGVLASRHYVTVSYHRTGSVPAPMGPVQSVGDPQDIIPNFDAVLEALNAKLTPEDFAAAGVPHQGSATPETTGGMDQVLIGTGAPVGVTLGPTSGVIGAPAAGGILPIMTTTAAGGPLASIFSPSGASAGWLGGMMPILLLGGLAYFLFKK